MLGLEKWLDKESFDEHCVENQYGQGKGTSISPTQIWLKREINYSTGHQRWENHLCLVGQHLLYIKRFNIITAGEKKAEM